MLARQVSRLCPSLVLAQNRNDLLFHEPATVHLRLILRGGKTQWQEPLIFREPATVHLRLILREGKTQWQEPLTFFLCYTIKQGWWWLI
jgi:hypothetical protein